MKKFSRINEEEIDTVPFPATETKERFGIFIFWFPTHGEHEEKKCEKPITWSVAPESNIQKLLEFKQINAVEKEYLTVLKNKDYNELETFCKDTLSIPLLKVTILEKILTPNKSCQLGEHCCLALAWCCYLVFLLRLLVFHAISSKFLEYAKISCNDQTMATIFPTSFSI